MVVPFRNRWLLEKNPGLRHTELARKRGNSWRSLRLGLFPGVGVTARALRPAAPSGRNHLSGRLSCLAQPQHLTEREIFVKGMPPQFLLHPHPLSATIALSPFVFRVLPLFCRQIFSGDGQESPR